jgi:hypothetical protein
MDAKVRPLLPLWTLLCRGEPPDQRVGFEVELHPEASP